MTTPSLSLELVARAIGPVVNDPQLQDELYIRKKTGCDPEKWLQEKIARAVIHALRDIPPEVLAAGCAAHPAAPYDPKTTLGEIVHCEWVAMIDEILK